MKKTPENDPIRLDHMLDAARKALKFVEGRSKEDLENDELLAFAVVRALEIVGEAANNVTAERQAELSNIPWPVIIGMRNRVVHAYFEVDTEIAWSTLHEDLPKLIEQLEQILAEEKREEDGTNQQD